MQSQLPSRPPPATNAPPQKRRRTSRFSSSGTTENVSANEPVVADASVGDNARRQDAPVPSAVKHLRQRISAGLATSRSSSHEAHGAFVDGGSFDLQSHRDGDDGGDGDRANTNPHGEAAISAPLPPQPSRRRAKSRFAQAQPLSAAQPNLPAGGLPARAARTVGVGLPPPAPPAPPPPARSAPPWPLQVSGRVGGPPLTTDVTAIPITPVSTLRINANVAKQKKLSAVLRVSDADLIDTDPTSNPYHDPNIRRAERAPRVRNKQFEFVQQGAVVAKAEREREQAQVQMRQRQYIDSLQSGLRDAAELPILPLLDDDLCLPEARAETVPDVEWWDAPFVENAQPPHDKSATSTPNEQAQPDASESARPSKQLSSPEHISLRLNRITHYIHHPPPISPTKPAKAPPVVPLMLTKKETKKLRRQRRMETQKEQQEMIAAGLLPPPKPKVKLSNVMRVLAAEASADPTKIEADVRAQIEARREKHEADNDARKKTSEERREKSRKKREDDKSAGLRMAVFRVLDLSDARHRFKLDTNARQLHMTGAVVFYRGCNVVLVEGGAKALRKYKALMLRRIDWNSGKAMKPNARKPKSEEPEDSMDTDEVEPLFRSEDHSTREEVLQTENQDQHCVLVWEGVTSSPSFPSFAIHPMKSANACRELLKEHGVEHVWDLCLQASPAGNSQLAQQNV